MMVKIVAHGVTATGARSLSNGLNVDFSPRSSMTAELIALMELPGLAAFLVVGLGSIIEFALRKSIPKSSGGWLQRAGRLPGAVI